MHFKKKKKKKENQPSCHVAALGASAAALALEISLSSGLFYLTAAPTGLQPLFITNMRFLQHAPTLGGLKG